MTRVTGIRDGRSVTITLSDELVSDYVRLNTDWGWEITSIVREVPNQPITDVPHPAEQDDPWDNDPEFDAEDARADFMNALMGWE